MAGRNRRTAALLAAFLIAAGGCMAILPQGNPPAGGITDNREHEARSPAEERSRLATRLAAAALSAVPRWKTLVLECEEELLPIAAAAANEAAAVAGFTVKRLPPGASESGCARLLGFRRGEAREFTLFAPDGAILWRDLLQGRDEDFRRGETF